MINPPPDTFSVKIIPSLDELQIVINGALYYVGYTDSGDYLGIRQTKVYNGPVKDMILKKKT